MGGLIIVFMWPMLLTMVKYGLLLLIIWELLLVFLCGAAVLGGRQLLVL